MNISILIFWVWPLKLDLSAIACISLEIFQSSFSEFDLWNILQDLYRRFNNEIFQSSFSEFDLWNNSKIDPIQKIELFQSSFSEFDLWNKQMFLLIRQAQLFQSSFSEFDLWNEALRVRKAAVVAFQSSFSEFDLWNLWLVWESYGSAVISILIFWVWPLKRPRVCKWCGENLSFQSSFSEFDLWNAGAMDVPIWLDSMISILIFWVWPLKPRLWR